MPEEESPRKVQKTPPSHSWTPGPTSRILTVIIGGRQSISLASWNRCFWIRWCSLMNPISSWHNSPSRWEKRESFMMIRHNKGNIKLQMSRAKCQGNKSRKGSKAGVIGSWKSVTRGASWEANMGHTDSARAFQQPKQRGARTQERHS